jgi:hypothetical protein
MAGTQVWRAARVRVATGRASAASRGDGRGPGVGRRLWTLLNAQGLLQGTVGGHDGVAVAEDDRRRFAARRAG